MNHSRIRDHKTWCKMRTSKWLKYSGLYLVWLFFRHKAVLGLAIIDTLSKQILHFVFWKWKKSLVTHSSSKADTNTLFWCFIQGMNLLYIHGTVSVGGDLKRFPIQPTALSGSATGSDCSGLSPGGTWKFPILKIVPPLWATCFTAWLSSWGFFFFLLSDGIYQLKLCRWKQNQELRHLFKNSCWSCFYLM